MGDSQVFSSGQSPLRAVLAGRDSFAYDECFFQLTVLCDIVRPLILCFSLASLFLLFHGVSG